MNALEVVSRDIESLIVLPDEEAAPLLNERMKMLDLIHRVHERTYPETGVIAREFEKRNLWKYLEDPDTGVPFSCFSAWAACSNFLGCRRTIFESKKDMEMLSDVPTAKLLSIPKGNIQVLTQLSTKVRNDPAVLEAAQSLRPKRFLEKLETEYPDQHIQCREPLRLYPSRDDREDIENAIDWALEHDIAGSVTEAIAKACHEALHQWKLDEELKNMPMEARA